MLTVKQLADYAGVSVRTLHYYDQIGLLKPGTRKSNRYRYYDDDAVLALQQIMFFRELDFSLEDIKAMVTRPDFNIEEALKQQKAMLQKKKERVEALLSTLDKTIKKTRDRKTMDIREYYKGFSEEQIENFREEVRRRWGDKVLEESESRVIQMGQDTFVELQAEGGKIFRNIYTHMSEGYKSKYVQEQIALWRQWLEKFHHYTDDEIVGLGRAYSQTREFAMFFDQYDDSLPLFLTKAIEHYISRKKRRSLTDLRKR